MFFRLVKLSEAGSSRILTFRGLTNLEMHQARALKGVLGCEENVDLWRTVYALAKEMHGIRTEYPDYEKVLRENTHGAKQRK